MELEYKVLKEILEQQKKTNVLLEQLINKGDSEDGRTTAGARNVSESEGTIRRKRGPKRSVQ